MAIFNQLEPNRFSEGSVKENSEKHRISMIRNHIPNQPPNQPDNNDFNMPNKAATFSKGLKHDEITGLVDSSAFAHFANALSSQREHVFDALNNIDDQHIGDSVNFRKWTNPVAGRAFAIMAGDPQQYIIPPAPSFGSDELSFEILENYWMALLRDVPFHEYENNPLAYEAAKELTHFHQQALQTTSDIDKIKLAAVNEYNEITPALLFRGVSYGDDIGPYISQFLIQPVPFGVQGFEQRNKTLKPHNDFMTSWQDWLAVQNGVPHEFTDNDFDENLHYIRNGRDLSQWVHIDVLFQAYFNACLIMLHGNNAPSAVGGGIGTKTPNTNPYNAAKHQGGFGTLGDPAHIGMVCEVAAQALKSVWYQKWYVHLRFRPEVYGGRLDYQRRVAGSFEIPDDLMQAEALKHVMQQYGSVLLPMAFPEGSPMHPAYGAGHATVAGACVTILKALFDVKEDYPNPMMVVTDEYGNDHLEPYTNISAKGLTIEGELNKLASNIALGRNIAGVHWRSDGTNSLLLGERVAIDLLCSYARSYAEFKQLSDNEIVFTFNSFDGKECKINTNGKHNF